MVYLKIDSSSLLLLLLFVFVVPVLALVLYELFWVKGALSKATYIVGGVTLAMTAFMYLSVTTAKIHIANDKLVLDQIFYSRSIPISEIKNLEFNEQITGDFSPTMRTNGIAFGKVRIGTFLTKSGKAFFMSSGGSVSVVKTEDQLLVFSSTRKFYEKLRKELD